MPKKNVGHTPAQNSSPAGSMPTAPNATAPGGHDSGHTA